MELVERLHERVQDARSHPAIQGDGETRRIPGGTLISLILLALATPSLCATTPPRVMYAIPAAAFHEAQRRARLADLLIQSIKNSAGHTFDLKLEKEIQKLLKEIVKQKGLL